MSLSPGIYEALLDEGLKGALARHPELRSIFGKLDPEEEPARLAAFVSKVLEQALRLEADSARRAIFFQDWCFHRERPLRPSNA